MAVLWGDGGGVRDGGREVMACVAEWERLVVDRARKVREGRAMVGVLEASAVAVVVLL